MRLARRILWGILSLAVVIVIGVIGYMIIEGWSFLDSLYMVVMTITTVGFNEVYPLSEAGQIFSVFLMLTGVGVALYILVAFVGYIVEGQLGATLRRQRMNNKIAKLKGHFILCGFGRVGEEIAHTFANEGVPFVVVDNRPDNAAMAEHADYLYLLGDATQDTVLLEAGIKKARGLVAAVGADIDNTYITLSARGLCPDLFIAARVTDITNETKLERAGANRVISPKAIGGRRMALLSLRPTVVDFIDTVAYRPGQDLQMETIEASPGSPLTGLKVAQARHRTGAIILAMIRKGGKLAVNPPEEETVNEGDRLIVIGTKKRLAALETISEEAKTR